jgi:predicted AAA+ superfamily ATPase
MPSTVRQLCQPHEAALDHVVADQIERLDQVLLADGADGDDFFAKNHITAGLKVLLTEGLTRLDGRSRQALFELRQAMGGGKTHSMIALGLLARDAALRTKHIPDINHGTRFKVARVVAVDGRSVDRTRHVWGDIITQLGKTDAGSIHWKDGPKPPTKEEWASYLGEGPTLILLDELPPYIDQASAVGAGEANLAKLAKYALGNLFMAAHELPRCCLVISSLTGTYQSASGDLHDLANEATRQARPLTPVDLATDEIYSILRRRLFATLPDAAAIASVANEYRSVIARAVTAQVIPSTARQIADEIAQTYPFHPSVKHIIALFRNNETYRQTRGSTSQPKFSAEP